MSRKVQQKYTIIGLLFVCIGYFPHQANAQSSVQWGPCSTAKDENQPLQCAFLETPLNYEEPDGTKIKIALYRFRFNYTVEKYQGIVLMNPGGPGSSGLSILLRVVNLPMSVMQSYDWIGFDPRGVDRSQPALSCNPMHQKGPRPHFIACNDDEEDYWTMISQNYADACAKNHSDVLPFMKTTDVVQDMDAIRHALGQTKINFIGYSYGTYLGQVYATMYPNRVRRMILDAIVDPRYIWFESNMRQNPGIDRNLMLWFDWLARHNAHYNLGMTRFEVEDKWNLLLEGLRTQPINGRIGPTDWFDSFTPIVYTQRVWHALGSVFSEWYNKKNSQPIMSIHASGNQTFPDNSYAVYLAVLCTDAQWPKGWSRWDVKQWWSHVRAPLSTWNNARLNWPCQYWPAPSNTPVRVIGRTNHRILLVGATLDAATPIEGAFEVRKRFPSATLITTINDPNHGTSLSGNKCVDDIVARYLENGTLPQRKLGNQADVTCQGPTEPTPSEQKSYFEQEIRDLLSKKTLII